MRILITGSNGFVGRILRQELLKKNYQVYGIDLKGGDGNTFPVDITVQDDVDSVIREISPEFIVHLAAISTITYNNPQSLYNININGTINVLNSSNYLKHKPGILFISSAQVYGSVDEKFQPINESVPLKPINHYGASKISGEKICGAFSTENGLQVVVARPFNHFGVGQEERFIIPKIINAFKEKREFIELGDISAVRDFLDVRDVVDAYIRIIEDFRENEVYNISMGNGVRMSDIIETAEDLTGHKLNIQFNNSFVRHNEMKISIGDSSKIRKELGWSPEYTLKDTLRWMLDN